MSQASDEERVGTVATHVGEGGVTGSPPGCAAGATDTHDGAEEPHEPHVSLFEGESRYRGLDVGGREGEDGTPSYELRPIDRDHSVQGALDVAAPVQLGISVDDFLHDCGEKDAVPLANVFAENVVGRFGGSFPLYSVAAVLADGYRPPPAACVPAGATAIVGEPSGAPEVDRPEPVASHVNGQRSSDIFGGAEVPSLPGMPEGESLVGRLHRGDLEYSSSVEGKHHQGPGNFMTFPSDQSPIVMQYEIGAELLKPSEKQPGQQWSASDTTAPSTPVGAWPIEENMTRVSYDEATEYVKDTVARGRVETLFSGLGSSSPRWKRAKRKVSIPFLSSHTSYYRWSGSEAGGKGLSSTQGILKSSNRSLNGELKKSKIKVGFSLPDGQRQKWDVLAFVRQFLSICPQTWEDIKAVLYTYEASAIPLRLVIMNRHPLDDSVLWPSEIARLGLPAVDLAIDLVLLSDTIVTSFNTFHKRQAQRLRELTEDKLSSVKYLDGNPFAMSSLELYLDSHSIAHVFLVLIYWVIAVQRVPMVVFWCSQVLRLPYLVSLSQYFSLKALQTNVNVSTLATFKFVLLVFLSTHYLGLMAYFFCIIARFDRQLEVQSWVVQFEMNNFIPVDIGPYLGLEGYLLCMYKGLNSLTNLGYEGTVPKRMDELIFAMVTFVIQMVVEAYILGTLTHYLVKRDPLDEYFDEFMQKVEQFCKTRSLPSDLYKRLRAFFEFQHQQQRHNTSSIAKYLPHSTQVALAHELYGSVVHRNRFLFRDINPQFITMMLTELREEFLMPGGIVFMIGDMARDLYFLMQGVIEKKKRSQVIGVIYGNQDGVNTLGHVAFVMSVPHSYTAQARVTGSATLLTLSRSSFERVLAPYSECYDQILGNLLEEYDMDRKGNVVHQQKLSLDVEERQERKQVVEAIQGALAKRNAGSMGAMKQAIKVRNMDKVSSLLREGFDINTVDYDGRTALHLAVAAGDIKLVEILVKDYNASTTVCDRGKRYPIDDAISNNHSAIVSFLSEVTQGMAVDSSHTAKYCRQVCYAAASGASEDVMRTVRSGLDPNTCLYGGRSALHIAARHGHLKVAEYLLEQGADLNAEDELRRTPLLDAILGGHTLMPPLLRFHGAHLGSYMANSTSAMLILNLASEGDITRLGMLVENGISPDVMDYDRRTAIHVTAANGMLLTVAYLLENWKANANPIDRWGRTPLQEALERDHMRVAVLLQAHGGSIGPSGDESLMEKLKGPNVPSIYSVKRDMNKMMRWQDQKGQKHIRDSATSDVLAVPQQATMLFIPEVHGVRQATELLSQLLDELDRSIGPLLLALMACMENPSRAAQQAVPRDCKPLSVVPSTAKAEQGGGGRQLTRYQSRSSRTAVRNPTGDLSEELLAITVLKLSGHMPAIQALYCTFVEARSPSTQVSETLARLALLVDPDKILSSMAMQTVNGESLEDLFQDSQCFYAAFLCSPALRDVLQGRSAVSMAAQFEASADVFEMCSILEDSLDCIDKFWEVINSKDDQCIDLAAISATSYLAPLIVAMDEVGFKELTCISKSDLALGLLHMAGLEDPLDQEDEDDMSDSGSDQSENESLAASGMDDSQSRSEQGVTIVSEQEQLEVLEDHKDLLDTIAVVLEAADEKLMQRDMMIENASAMGRAFIFLKQMLQETLERTFASMIFSIMMNVSRDKTGTLDDYWLLVLTRVLLVHESKRIDRSLARAIQIRKGMENLSSALRVDHKSFVDAFAPLLRHQAAEMEDIATDEEHTTISWREGLRFVIHPNAKWLSIWAAMNRSIAIFFSLDVPFRIAFHSFKCFGRWYVPTLTKLRANPCLVWSRHRHQFLSLSPTHPSPCWNERPSVCPCDCDQSLSC
mmetsp:Transcript_5758/g.16161  ORF Transcript_5758/g.16161 Transcript_5758/m.16161 type:complete len:1854 (-) Transcript_5758:3600-9161(-)